jgi:hypothetical protein
MRINNKIKDGLRSILGFIDAQVEDGDLWGTATEEEKENIKQAIEWMKKRARQESNQ